MKIRVLESRNVDEFADMVNRFLDAGWELHGEASIRTTQEGGDDWDGRRRPVYGVTRYTQIMKRAFL